MTDFNHHPQPHSPKKASPANWHRRPLRLVAIPITDFDPRMQPVSSSILRAQVGSEGNSRLSEWRLRKRMLGLPTPFGETVFRWRR